MIECGIHSWGFAIPRRRLPNAATQGAWNRNTIPGSRSIAGADEDSLTLGVQAAMQAVQDQDRSDIDGLLFASTTAPWAEKSSAVLIADILGLHPSAKTIDLNASLRSGTTAIATACDMIKSGSCNRVLVVAADTRCNAPGSLDEFLFGQAGVAIVIGHADTAVADIRDFKSTNCSAFDTWRSNQSRFPVTADIRFARQEMYAKSVEIVCDYILESCSMKPTDISKVVIFSPDAKSGTRVLKKKGFDPKTQYMDRVSPHLGLTGTPHTLLMLAAALEKSSSGESLLCLDYGDGASALVLQMKNDPKLEALKPALKSGYDISYPCALNLQAMLVGSETVDSSFTSEIMEDRNRSLWFSLTAKRCGSCETVITLPLPHCPHCGPESEVIAYPLEKTGTVFSVTHEHYFPTAEPPLGMAVINLDGGGRLTLQVADENDAIVIGDKVELVFRRLHNAGSRPNYFWKCRKRFESEVQHV